MKAVTTALLVIVFMGAPSAQATKGGYEGVLAKLNVKRAKQIELGEDIRKLNARIAPLRRKTEKELERHNALGPIKKKLDLPRHMAAMTVITAQIAPHQQVLNFKTIQYSIVEGSRKRLAKKCERLQCEQQKYPLYVIAISGGGGGYIERLLRLEDVLQSENASYRQANWNNYYKATADKEARLPTAKEFDRFQDEVELAFQRMPERSKLVIIGHSLGGGAAAKMTETAKKIDRRIDHLVLLDPVGELGVRVNATHRRPLIGPCPPPRFTDENGKERGSDVAYRACQIAAKKHRIPKQVRHFFHRWQTQEMWPIDYETDGKFDTAKGVRVDQKSVAYGHGEILNQYAEKVRQIVEGYL